MRTPSDILDDIPTLPDEDVEDFVDEAEAAGFIAGSVAPPAAPPAHRRYLPYVAVTVALIGIISTVAAAVGLTSGNSGSVAPSVPGGGATMALAAPLARGVSGGLSASVPMSVVPAREELSSASASTVAPASSAGEAGATETEVNPAAAHEATVVSQHALEHGKLAEAIAAGERAVALDPTVADGWLVLGAAYLQQGARDEARRCFTSCVKLAKHGPRAECAALSR